MSTEVHVVGQVGSATFIGFAMFRVEIYNLLREWW